MANAPEGSRPAFYALAPGGWRDYWTLLHPPYTAWHLSYVAMGSAIAPSFNGVWLGKSLLAFFLGVGLSAHALDELKGRPLRTRIPAGVLWAIAGVGLAGAVALGVDATIEVSAWMVAFIAVGAFLLVAYNLELFGGAFHSDLWFALAWGGFPALTGYFVQSGTLRVEAFLLAVGCTALSAAQRTLSSPVRELRRHAVRVSGKIELDDGVVRPIDATTLRTTQETALRLLTLATIAIAVALVAARVL
ncbi:MAG: hypothetical protein M3O84_01705 [Actinomycetota bacterium]|nr:hypothetical protein [Actinomycetota bacterium]